MSSRNGSRSALALLRGQPRALRVAALVQLPDQRPAGRAPGLRRQELAGRGARPAPPGRAAWCAALGCTNGRELPDGISVDHVLGDAEEAADPVQRVRAGRRRASR